MKFRRAVVVARAAFPDAKVWHTIGAFDVEDQILEEGYFVRRVDDLGAGNGHFNKNQNVQGYQVHLEVGKGRKVRAFGTCLQVESGMESEFGRVVQFEVVQLKAKMRKMSKICQKS